MRLRARHRQHSGSLPADFCQSGGDRSADTTYLEMPVAFADNGLHTARLYGVAVSWPSSWPG